MRHYRYEITNGPEQASSQAVQQTLEMIDAALAASELRNPDVFAEAYDAFMDRLDGAEHDADLARSFERIQAAANRMLAANLQDDTASIEIYPA